MKENNKKYYPEIEPSVNFSKVEESILKKWDAEKTFDKSISNREGANEFVFYDGPPFANGLPHYGHILTGFVKDIIPRFQTMKGSKVDRVFGWDCHGLPAEMESEKELGITGRKQIQEFGVENFNNHCQESVMKYTKEWEVTVGRQARWVDFENDYKTMDLDYMESVMWAFKQLWDKGLVYEKDRVMPYSWKAETPLSNFETRLDDSYRERKDPAVTIKFEINDSNIDFENSYKSYLLAWTTTPWTLPSNLACAVGKDIDYSLITLNNENLIIASSVLENFQDVLEGYKTIKTIKGNEILGTQYIPIFDYFKDTKNAFKVLEADFVNTEEGTGIVHMAPGFGEDDQLVCEKNNISIVCPVDDQGKFTSEVKEYENLLVFDANEKIISDLKQRNIIVKKQNYLHNYPHCWRTDEPLIYKSVNSWYVEVSSFKDRMVELNQEISWTPDHIKDGTFGKWLAGARDWSISRNRFWGTPIPVWKSDDPKYPRVDVYGSLDEIEKDFGTRPNNLHRPHIDKLTRPNPDDPTGKSKMIRVTEVFDCWFESGSMPFAQVHYPFENKSWFESHFPADFIVEYIGQTRGWFYTMMVLSTAIFDRPPFKNCICHGIVLDTNGVKLSKKLRNYPEPEMIWDKYGADSLRWFLSSSPVLKGQNLQIDMEGKGISDAQRLIITPLWNAFYFFCLYANAENISAKENYSSKNPLDIYALLKTRELIENIEKNLEEYDISSACQAVPNFIDAINNWYIRRSRPRFWKHADDTDSKNAYDTLYTVLLNATKVLSPLMPLISEEIYTKLTSSESVHLCDWPNTDSFPNDAKFLEQMDLVRDISSAGLGIRKTNNIRVRQPLKEITIAGDNISWLSNFENYILEEVNAKKMILDENSDSLYRNKIKINLRKMGPKLGKNTKKYMEAANNFNWVMNDNKTISILDLILEEDEYILEKESNPGTETREINDGKIVVSLNIDIDNELKVEGIARDILRAVQNKRKDENLDISDKIKIKIFGENIVQETVSKFGEYIASNSLAENIEFSELNDNFIKISDELSVNITIEKI
ncbi:MAG: isoleucine--tRNA ligase [Chloroflexi bacterium]|nr:isoleucine--tRNA ligase [Chloroflexota bacterium]|tara:strand:- start:11208 stop:14351 length:3144 start_codon:yes stop_codon:yes gene_type:complete